MVRSRQFRCLWYHCVCADWSCTDSHRPPTIPHHHIVSQHLRWKDSLLYYRHQSINDDKYHSLLRDYVSLSLVLNIGHQEVQWLKQWLCSCNNRRAIVRLLSIYDLPYNFGYPLLAVACIDENVCMYGKYQCFAHLQLIQTSSEHHY